MTRVAMRDIDVRAAVRRLLDEQYRDDPSTRIVEEMGIWSGSARIDVAVINGELCGYELKSDSDTLVRLPAQALLYGRVFDRVVIVAGSRHVEKVRTLVPDWWGITVAIEDASGAINLSAVRAPQLNPSPDPYLIAQLLWKDEALAVLDDLGAAKGYRSKTARAIHERVAAVLPLPELSKAVRDTLKRRKRWLGQFVCDEGEMPINANLDPRCATS